MVEEFLKNNWLILINIPVFIVSIGTFLILFGTYKRFTRISKEIRLKFITDLEKEKRQISRELHDSISSFTIRLKDYFSNDENIEMNERRLWVEEILNFEMYMANINENIYPSEFLEGNIYTALECYINTYKESSLNISLWINDEPEIHRRDGIHIYRIIQESVVNIAKHTESKHLTIFVNKENNLLKIILSYHDNKTDKQLVHIHSSKRGRKIIDERISILNGKKEVILNDDLISEVFTFNL